MTQTDLAEISAQMFSATSLAVEPLKVQMNQVATDVAVITSRQCEQDRRIGKVEVSTSGNAIKVAHWSGWIIGAVAVILLAVKLAGCA